MFINFIVKIVVNFYEKGKWVNKMTKKEAINYLINDFENQCIAANWMLLSDIDWEIVVTLKIKIKKEVEEIRGIY